MRKTAKAKRTKIGIDGRKKKDHGAFILGVFEVVSGLDLGMKPRDRRVLEKLITLYCESDALREYQAKRGRKGGRS